MFNIIKGLILGLTLCLIIIPTDSYSNPQGGVVAAGTVEISIPSANTMQINQSSDKAVINWQSYNIQAHERVNYQQPNSNSISLNRVNPHNGVSTIYGSITANGRVWLVNPAGIWFGPTAHVDVAGLLATTAGISDADFLAGRFRFIQDPHWNGAIINEGYIKTSEAGLVALVGSGVVNNGMIEANLGTVVLAAGSEFTINFSGNEMIGFTVDKAVIEPAQDQNGNRLADGVTNTGTIMANGGKIMMSAHTASDILDHTINMKGVVQANSVGVRNGEIILDGGKGKVSVSGKVYASGRKQQEKGGTVKITGKYVILTDAAMIDVSGNNGGGTALIGGNAHGAGPEQNAEGTYIGSDVKIFADALEQGNGGLVVAWSDMATYFYGSIFARGGISGGDGGWVETSGGNLSYNGNVDTSAVLGALGSLLLDPKFLEVVIAGGSAYSAGTNNLFANNSSGTNLITPASINAANANITLQANTDVTFTDALSMTNTGRTLTVQAGRSILINNDITTTNGAITMTANDTASTSADRDAGPGSITMAADKTMSSGNGAISLTVGSSTTGGYTPGDISVVNLTTTGANSISITSPNSVTLSGTVSSGSSTTTINTNTGANSANDFTIASGGSITTTNTGASAVTINVNAAGGGTGGAVLGGNITTGGGGRITIATNTGGNSTGGSITQSAGTLSVGGGSFVLSVPTGSSSSIGTSGTNISTTSAGGTVTLTAGTGGAFISNTGNLTLAAPTLATNSPLSVISSGTLTLPAASISTGTGDLTLKSNGGALATIATRTLTTTSGILTLTGSTGLTINSGLTTGSGNLVLSTTTSGNISQASGGSISSTSGNLTLTARDAITLSDTTNVGSGKVIASANTDGAGTNNFTMNSGSSITTTNTEADAISIAVNTAVGGAGAATLRDITTGSTGTLTVTTDTGGNTTGGTITTPTGTLTIGSLLMSTPNTITLTAAISAGGTLSFAANSDGSGGQDFTMAAGSSISTTSTSASAVTINVNSSAGGTGTAAIRDITTGSGATVTIKTDTGGNTTGTDITMPSGTIDVGTGIVTLTTPQITGNNIGTAALPMQIKAGILNGTTGTAGLIVTNTGTSSLDLGTIDSTGVFTLSSISSSGITDSGTLTVSGVMTVAAGSGQDITLNSTSNDFATATITSGKNVTLTDTNGIILGASTISGTFNLNTGGAITQSGTIAVTGSTTITAGSGNDISLGTSTNDFSTVAITSGNNVTLRDTNTLDLGTSTVSGTLALTTSAAGGSITQSGALAVTGTTTIVASTTNDVTLNNSDNDFSAIAVTSGNNVELRDSNSLILGTSTVSGTFGLTTNGSITQSGAVIVTGATTLAAGSANDITLGTTANNFSTLGVTSGNNVTLRDTNAVILAASTVATNLTVTAGGAITQSGILTVPTLIAKTLLSGGAAITLDSFSNEVSSVDFRTRNPGDTANAAGAIAYLDATGFAVAAANTTSTVTLTGKDDITQTGSMTGTTLTVKTLKNTGAAITLNDSANAFTTIDLRARNAADTANAAGPITYQDANSIAIAAIDTTNTFALSANTSITQTGAMIIGGIATFIATAASTDFSLASADNDLSSTPVFTTSGSGAIRDLSLKNISSSTVVPTLPSGLRNLALDFPNAGMTLPGTTLTGTLQATADGAITQSGALVVSGTTTLAAGSTNNITLNDSSNNFSTVTVTTGNNVTLQDSNALILGAMTVSGFLSVTSGAITQSGTLLITGLTTLATGASNIALGTATNDFSTVKVTSANNVTLRDANTIDLGLSTIGGTLSVTASGASGGITQSDALTVTGATTLVASSANNISLGTLTNDFSTVTITSGNNVTLADTNAMILGASTVTGDLTITTGGTLSDTGSSTVSGSNGLTATTVGGMSINGASTHIAKLNVNNSGSGNITFVTLDPLTITGFSQSGGGTTTITDTGTLTVANGVTVNSSNAALTITATDLDLSTTGALNSGNAATSITQNTVGGSIGLGSTSGTMTISSSELQRITATGLTLISPTDGQIIVDGNSAASSGNIAGTIILTATAGTLGTISFQSDASSFGAVTATADNGISISSDLATTVGALTLTVNAATLSVADGVTVSTNGSALTITATDVNLNTTGALNSSSGDTSITQNTASGSIGLGATAGTMTISGSELQRITANNLNLIAPNNGQIVVDGITAANGANISSTTTLTATAGTLGTITFQNSTSSFKALTANADDGIAVNAAVVTTVGNMTLDADANGAAAGNDALILSANLTAAGSMTLSALNGGIVLAAPVNLTANGITVNHKVNGAFNLTVDSGSSLTSFASTVGATTPIGSGVGAAITLNSIGTTTFSNTVATNSGINADAAVVFDNLVSLGNGNTASIFNGLVTLSNATGYTFSGFDGLSFNAGLTTSGGAMTVDSNNSLLSIAGLTLGNTVTLLSAGGAINITGTVSGSGQTLVLHDNTSASTGTVTFSSNVMLGALTTLTQPYAVVFTGASNTINNAMTFNNTTTTTLGDGGDTFSFNNGLTVLSNLINLASTISTNGSSLTLGSSASNQTQLNGATSLASNGGTITINSLLDGAQNLTFNAGSVGNININADIGSSTRLNQLLLQSLRNLTSTGKLNVTSYAQSSGRGTTNFSGAGLNTTTSASITATNLLGNINVGSLTINLNRGNFFGQVDGKTGISAIKTFTVLNPIEPNKIFFDNIDIYIVIGGPPINPALIFPTNYETYTQPLLYYQTDSFEPKKISNDCLMIGPNIEMCGLWDQN